MHPKPPRIQTVARVSAIIDIVAAGAADGLALSNVCRATGLNKTTAFNLLSSLISVGFVEQDANTKRYRLGLRNIELGRLTQQRLHVPDIARPILIDLCRQTNETVSLAIPDLLDMLVVDSFKSSRFLQATAYVGSRSPYHCTALGKSVLAHWNESMRRNLYRLRDLTQLTPHTITDVDILEAQLPEILARGYATDIEENEIGVTCIGTTIFDGFGEVAGAISVTAPSNRLTAENINAFAVSVVKTASRISMALGYEAHCKMTTPKMD